MSATPRGEEDRGPTAAQERAGLAATLPEPIDGLDLRVTLHKLNIFCHVVEAGGVTRAAEQMFLTQPVVTTHIRTLEDRLGSKLFYRSGRHNLLTEAGERVYHWGREILRSAHELGRELEEIEGGSRGSVTIAATMSAGSYLLPPLIAGFAKEHPNVMTSLAVSDRASTEEAVQLGQADFAVAIGELPRPSDWLDFELIGEEQLVVVAPPDFEGEGPLTREQIEALRFVDGPRSGRRELAERRLRTIGVQALPIAMELGHPEAIKRAVELGAGAAVLFRHAVRDTVAAGNMRELTVEGVDMAFPVIIVSRRDKEFSSAQTEMMDQIRGMYEGGEIGLAGAGVLVGEAA